MVSMADTTPQSMASWSCMEHENPREAASQSSNLVTPAWPETEFQNAALSHKLSR